MMFQRTVEKPEERNLGVLNGCVKQSSLPTCPGLLLEIEISLSSHYIVGSLLQQLTILLGIWYPTKKTVLQRVWEIKGVLTVCRFSSYRTSLHLDKCFLFSYVSQLEGENC